MNRLKELRKSKNLAQKELAELLGCATATVTKYEKEQRKLPQEVITKLCDIFDCTSDYLLGISDINAKSPAVFSGAENIPDEFKRLQEANEVFLRLNESGKAQALAYLKFLESQQET